MSKGETSLAGRSAASCTLTSSGCRGSAAGAAALAGALARGKPAIAASSLSPCRGRSPGSSAPVVPGLPAHCSWLQAAPFAGTKEPGGRAAAPASAGNGAALNASLPAPVAGGAVDRAGSVGSGHGLPRRCALPTLVLASLRFGSVMAA